MRLIKSILLVIVPLYTLYAEEELFNEADLFNDTAMTIDSQVTQKFSSSSVDSTRVAFSGDIKSVVEFSANKQWFEDFKKKDFDPGASVVANGLLDIRFPMGFKAFANVETQYQADSNVAHFSLQELFIDANIHKKVYFRTGKQVLQWGRCYFWNPTDLINIDRKKFVQDVGYLEGTYGIKAHAPIGTRFNFYGFVDMNKFKSVDSLAASAKIEVLLGNTEIATAIWGKRNNDPVFGLDFSTSLLKININGELSLTSGDNYSIPDEERIGSSLSTIRQGGSGLISGKLPMTTIDKKVVPRVCLGLSRNFDLLDVTNRVNVVTEIYFNGAGYDENIIEKYQIGDLIKDLQTLSISDPTGSVAGNLQGNLGSFLNPNNHSRWYGAFFVNVNKFIISDLTLSVNGIANLNHRCAMISTGLQYTNMHRFSLGLIVNTIWGSENNEYTLTGDKASLRMTAGVSF